MATRWALIALVVGERYTVRLITEDRIAAWEAHDWTVVIRDSEILNMDIADVRQDDERGRR
jgi:hypothetical protein